MKLIIWRNKTHSLRLEKVYKDACHLEALSKAYRYNKLFYASGNSDMKPFGE